MTTTFQVSRFMVRRDHKDPLRPEFNVQIFYELGDLDVEPHSNDVDSSRVIASWQDYAKRHNLEDLPSTEDGIQNYEKIARVIATIANHAEMEYFEVEDLHCNSAGEFSRTSGEVFCEMGLGPDRMEAIYTSLAHHLK